MLKEEGPFDTRVTRTTAQADIGLIAGGLLSELGERRKEENGVSRRWRPIRAAAFRRSVLDQAYVRSAWRSSAGAQPLAHGIGAWKDSGDRSGSVPKRSLPAQGFDVGGVLEAAGGSIVGDEMPAADTSVVFYSDATLNASQARATLARISSALAVQTNVFGLSL